MPTTPENVTSWRDLTDQLTPEEIAGIEAMELAGETRGNLLVVARSSASARLAVNMIGDVPPPRGAVRVYEWDDLNTAEVHRSFDLASWDIDGDEIAVDLSGRQYTDGRADLEVLVHLDAALTLAEARQLGMALLAAADNGEQWIAESPHVGGRVQGTPP
jgi:hypothetical protein